MVPHSAPSPNADRKARIIDTSEENQRFAGALKEGDGQALPNQNKRMNILWADIDSTNLGKTLSVSPVKMRFYNC